MFNSTINRKFLFSLSIASILILMIFTKVDAITKTTVAIVETKNNQFSFSPPTVPFKGVYACNDVLDDTFPLTNPGATTNYYWGSPDIDGVVERWAWSTI